MNSNAAALLKFADDAKCAAPPPSGSPWNNPSINAEFLSKRGSLVCPAPNTTNSIVVDFTIPAGWRAVISEVAFFYTGGLTPPIEGDSTNLYYSVRINTSRLEKDFAVIPTTLGSAQLPFPVPGCLRYSGGTRIQGLVTVPAGSPISTAAPAYVHMFFLGWQWPENQ